MLRTNVHRNISPITQTLVKLIEDISCQRLNVIDIIVQPFSAPYSNSYLLYISVNVLLS